MKLLSSLTMMIALVFQVPGQTPTPVSSEAEAQVRRELIDAARAYREGNFAEAQAHSEKALLLDPQNKTAPYFVARTIHAQYKPGDTTPGNLAKAREAIVAYQKILNRFPGDDEAFKAVAYLYGVLHEDQLLRQWLIQRAGDASIANEKRAEAFVVLASKDWDCSFKITELPGNKVTTLGKPTSYVTYHMPKERADFERAKECADRGLEMVNMAITLTPDSESAWSYKTNILLELSKLAEMSGQSRRKRELQGQYEQALKETMRLAKRSESSEP
jgi:tetratricopeptide (TPR) repeat protein